MTGLLTVGGVAFVDMSPRDPRGGRVLRSPWAFLTILEGEGGYTLIRERPGMADADLRFHAEGVDWSTLNAAVAEVHPPAPVDWHFVAFTFAGDGSPEFYGWTDGTSWNGWPVVRTTVREAEIMAAWMADMGDDMADEVAQIRDEIANPSPAPFVNLPGYAPELCPGAEHFPGLSVELSHDPTADEVAGFEAFWTPKPSTESTGAEWTRGYEMAARRCYGRGVKDSMGQRDPDCPWPQFSPAWESWADGFNAEGGI